MSELIEYTAEFLKTLSDVTRLQILELLKDSTTGVSSKELESTLDKSQSTISQHLKVLDNVNLITSEKRENIKYYKVKDEYLFKIISQIKSFVVNINREKIKELSQLDRFDALS